ncbi:PQQ-binding-like beta-propeller repeat protein [Natrialba sp. PRR66]|uniref:outer membrane protein assembly factor BamB family protein n=1 Tax=Natrialba sp. PRR66 TaxID=3098146 RepID=UPI002B1D813A|nr:PQQ-binding-like beta-propeller repeat protein [Natrialba sp. PRR66]
MDEHDSNPLEEQSFQSTRRRGFLRGAAGACLLSGIGTGIAASGESDEGAESSAGEELWRVDFANSEYLRGPSLSSVADGSLFVSNPDAVHALSASTGDEEWQFGVDDTRFHDPPIVVDGTVFATTNDPSGQEGGDGKDTSVYALDADTGEQKWQFDEYEDTVAPIHVAENTVFIPSQFCVYAVDATTGEQRWQFEVGYGVETNPRTDFFAETATGTLYVADGDGNVFAVDVATGEEEWRADAGTRVTTELSVVDGTLFLGAFGSDMEQPTNSELQYYVSALDAATGDERWRFTLNPEPGLESPTLEFVTVIDDTLFAGSDACADYPTCASLYAVDAASGEEKWQFEADNSVDTVTEADGTLFVGTAVGNGDDGVVHAVDPETGTELWCFLAGNLLLSPITVIEDTLFVVSRTDTDFEDAYRLNALDTATGDEKWNFIADTDVGGPRFADGTVFVSADRATVHALDAGVERSNEDGGTDDDSSEDRRTDENSGGDTEDETNC